MEWVVLDLEAEDMCTLLSDREEGGVAILVVNNVDSGFRLSEGVDTGKA